MDTSVASNAVVATVGMYVAALAEKDREIAELREQGRESAVLFTQLMRALEASKSGLRVESGEEAVQLAVMAVREGARAAQQTMEIGCTRAALRELGKLVNPRMQWDGPDGLVAIVAVVAKEVADMIAHNTWPSGSGVPGYHAVVSELLYAARLHGAGLITDRGLCRLQDAAAALQAFEQTNGIVVKTA